MKHRDITSMKLTRNILEFKTKVTPFMEDLKLEYIKKEQLEFKSEADAAIYFNDVCKELNSEELPKQLIVLDKFIKEATIAEEVFYNKELSDAIRELSTRSTLDYYKALKLLKFSKDYTRDVHAMKEMANVGISMDLLVTTIKAINN